MKRKLTILLSAGLFLVSCGMFKFYNATYSVVLSSVESPADAKQQFGDTKVVNFKDENVSKYRYEDDYINIVWFVNSKQFNFELKNKSSHTLKINWDDVSYVDINGETGRVMHAGIKYTDRHNSMAPTTIPRNAKISDLILPSDNVYYVSGEYGGWRETTLIPSSYSSDAERNVGAPLYVGKKMLILMPIIIENVQNDYVFEFTVDEWIKPE